VRPSKNRAYRLFRTKSAYPKSGTVASKQFFEVIEELNGFVSFVVGMVAQIERTAQIAHEALTHGLSKEEKEEKDRKFKQRQSTEEVLRRYGQLLMEVVLVCYVESYLNYLGSLLFEIFTQRPETLKSADKLEVAFVLGHGTMDDLVRSIAERKVDSLSYESFGHLSEFFGERFGLELFAANDVPKVIEAIETRNIAVHNRCIINERYLSRTGASRGLLGKRKDVGLSDVNQLDDLLVASVRKVDQDARRKLRLKGRRYAIGK
jgi:hypothetical protein